LRNILISHCFKYPGMELPDYIKLIYQNEFGGGHMISDLSESERFLRTEFETASRESRPESLPFTEAIGNGLCRMHLSPSYIKPDELSVPNLLFAATANTHQGSVSEFQKKASLLHELAARKLLPLDKDSVKAYLEEYLSKGCPPVRHSEAYRETYHPHYRVVKTAYADYFPLFRAIQKLSSGGRPIIVAIDGRCASGKSTLADRLAEVFGCNVFHMDDFFLPSHMRTKERLSRPGGNIDHERFAKEVLTPLAEGRDVCFQPYDCAAGRLKPPVSMPAGPISVVEGSYSHHPAFSDRFDLRVFLTCSSEAQKQRLLLREGQNRLDRFINEWIPMEELYFRTFLIPERCDLSFDTTAF